MLNYSVAELRFISKKLRLHRKIFSTLDYPLPLSHALPTRTHLWLNNLHINTSMTISKRKQFQYL